MTAEQQKDSAYWERNQLVAALSKIFPAYLAKHDENDKEWDEDWRTIVVIELPANVMVEQIARRSALKYEAPGIGASLTYTARETDEMDDQWYVQLTWHVHDFEVGNFDHLHYKYDYAWDGHTTEEKYRRLRGLRPEITL